MPILPNVFSCYVTILYPKISSSFVRHGSSKISSQTISILRKNPDSDFMNSDPDTDSDPDSMNSDTDPDSINPDTDPDPAF